MLGFNHIPLQGVSVVSNGNCPSSHYYSYFADSDGFWLVNRDGSNLRRMTTFELEKPAWSPDGKWIAFCNNGQIWKMPFDGVDFDTTRIYQLTSDSADHFFPSWSAAGDSIFFDSDEDDVNRSFQVHKMAADGTGQINIGNKGPDSIFSSEPYCTPANQILHIRGDSISNHVYTMDALGDHVRQLTFNISPNIYIHNPRSFGSKVYFEDHGVWSSNLDGSDLQVIALYSTQGFSVARDGTIAYVNLELYDNSPGSVIDRTHGVVWIMGPDGSNKRQLTFNRNY